MRDFNDIGVKNLEAVCLKTTRNVVFPKIDNKTLLATYSSLTTKQGYKFRLLLETLKPSFDGVVSDFRLN